MKRLLLIILLGIGAFNSALAQQYFNLRDAMHGIGTILTSVVQHNSKYYVTGLTTDSINYIGNDQFTNVAGIRFAVFDSTGHKLRDTVYQKAYLKIMEPASTGSLYHMPDNSFILASRYQDTNKQYAMIVKFDSMGNMLWERMYTQPLCNENDWYKITDMKPTPGGEWLILGDIFCDINATQKRNAMVLTKLNSNFDVLWNKQYGDATLNDYPGKILVENDGYVLSGSRNNFNLVQIGFSSRAELIRTDTAGNEQWTYLSDPTKLTYIANDVIRTQDGGYAYCGSGAGYEYPNETHTYADVFFKDWVEKIDAAHNHVWSKSYNNYWGTTQLKIIKEASSGDFLLFGDKYRPVMLDSTHWNFHTKGWFMTLAANGDSLREHVYYHMYTCDDNNSFQDVKQTSDGGFIMVGESTDHCPGNMNPSQRGWLLKVDSNGCVSPTVCEQPDTATAVKQLTAPLGKLGVTVYPNPTKGVFTINSPVNGMLSIISMEGREIISYQIEKGQTSLQVPEGMNAGVYIGRCIDTATGQVSVIRLLYAP